MKKLLLILAFAPTVLIAQSKKQRKALEEQQKADKIVIDNLKAHVTYLADDKLEGRSTGSTGEALAMQYIINQFKNIGLQPKGTNGFVQEFVVEDGKQIEPSTYFSVNGNKLELKKEFIPLAFSATKQVAGMPAMALREKGVPWFMDVKDLLDGKADQTKIDINEAIKKEAARVFSKGATALIVYNSSSEADNMQFDGKDESASSPIPVLYIMPAGYKKYFSDQSQLLDIDLNVSLKESHRLGHNIVGAIDNGASSAVVIGAHYDHVGLGEDNNVLDPGKIIRNGADDNASGTALLIELARMLTTSKAKSNNYIFIAFSGEELGLMGSKYWLQNPTVATPVNYMINLDGVGRYDAENKLVVGGYTTSSSWQRLFTETSNKFVEARFDSVVSGKGDYISFYQKSIPVLYFTTGVYSDYHKATDVADKINYEGELQIGKYIKSIIENTDAAGKLAFTKAPEPTMLAIKYSVSLGVIPDYSYTAGGLKINGITAQKLASKIGLESGDILTQLGDYPIRDMHSYMQALSNFKTGDKTVLKIKRGKEDKELSVQF